MAVTETTQTYTIRLLYEYDTDIRNCLFKHGIKIIIVEDIYKTAIYKFKCESTFYFKTVKPELIKFTTYHG